MATGFIGTSVVSESNAFYYSGNGAVTTHRGEELTYTCPPTGVRYAVVSVNVSGYVISLGTAKAYLEIGMFTLMPAIEGAGFSASENTSYSVILAPGQVWSERPFFHSFNNFTNTYGKGKISASVLEIV